MSATTSTPIHPVLSNRRSPRSFDAAATISNEALVAILEAARWAPSANNFQPWRFHVGVRGDEVFNSILATLVPFNQSWANRASALVLVSIVNQNEDGTPRPISGFDAGLAVSQLTFEAHSRDQVAHQMAITTIGAIWVGSSKVCAAFAASKPAIWWATWSRL